MQKVAYIIYLSNELTKIKFYFMILNINLILKNFLSYYTIFINNYLMKYYKYILIFELRI